MNKMKKIALIIATVVLMAVCFIFGASAAEPTFEDYVNAGVVNPETQTIVRVRINGASESQPIGKRPIGTAGVILIKESEYYYDIVPKSAYDMTVGSYVGFVQVVFPEGDRYFNGWRCENSDRFIKPYGSYKVTADDCGKIVEIIADYQPLYREGVLGYIVKNGKAILVDVATSAEGDLIIPSTLGGYPVVEIAGWTINYCDEITSITIPEGVTALGDHAIYQCDKVTEIKLPSTLRRLEESSLKDLDSLAKLTFPEGLEHIGSDLITYNMLINSINIPSTVKTIDFVAFNTCMAVEDVYFYSKDAEIGSFAFGYSECKLADGYSLEDFNLVIQKFMEETDEVKKAELNKELNEMLIYGEFFVGEFMTFHCYHGSTAETYAKENGININYFHDFGDGEWIYDYDNLIRYRECVYPDCDYREVEELEIEELTGDNFLVVEETVTNGIEGDVEVLRAFDINLKNSEGVHIQPDGTIKVKLPLDWGKDGVYKVYRVNDDGTLTDMNAYREGSHMVFDTDHFSIYVIVFVGDEVSEEEPETPDVPAENDSDCACGKEHENIWDIIICFIREIIKTLLFPSKA